MTVAPIVSSAQLFLGSVERAGSSTIVLMPCPWPGDLRLRRRSRLAEWGRSLKGALAVGASPLDFARGVAIWSSTQRMAEPLLAAPDFRDAALEVLEFAVSLELDGSDARAVLRETDDIGAIHELARRLSLVCAAVRSIFGGNEPDEDELWEVPRSQDLRFVGPLVELVAVGLYRPALDALCAGTGVIVRPPIDRSYLLKVLEEEVSRQFGHPLRPIVELILNGVDASREPFSKIRVHVDEESVTVEDSGEGMNLRTILSRLLLPFATDKVPGATVGRFGIGFFSVLGMGLCDPPSFSLSIDTGDGEEGFSLCVVAGGRAASTLSVSLRVATPRQGTRIRLSSALIEADALRVYLRDALHFFPEERAIIELDGAPLNNGSLLSGGRLYEETTPSGHLGRFYLGGHGLSGTITAATYHAGVKVEACFALGELVLLDFPAAVELTEGRDALKPGPEFASVVTTFHRRLGQIASEINADQATRDRIAEIAAQLSALMLQSVSWNEVAAELARVLLGPERYLISPDRAEAVLGFLGPEVTPRLFVTESFWAEREWHGFLPGERELLEDELIFEPPEPLTALARRRPDLPGLNVLVERTANPATLLVSLTLGRQPAGPMPCLGTRRAILVRGDAQAILSPTTWVDLYALRTSFDRAAGMREADVERELIVSSRVGGVDRRAEHDERLGEPRALRRVGS